MPQFMYRGRDQSGQLRTGQRIALSVDELNDVLMKEGIIPIQIVAIQSPNIRWEKLKSWMQGKNVKLEELAVFFRQMQLLHSAGVSIIVAIKQLASYTRSCRLNQALLGVVGNLENGQNLTASMQNYPDVFSPLMINIVQIGENTGRLDQAFSHISKYIEFELTTKKQVKTAFRYPIFVLITIIVVFIILNIFVIPSFSRFYSGLQMPLPWETTLIIGVSHCFVEYGIYLSLLILLGVIILIRYTMTPAGSYHWHKIELRLPIVGRLLQHVFLIRFCQSLAIILNSGISLATGLTLAKNSMTNTYIKGQIAKMQEQIERGMTISQAIEKVALFTMMEIQILAVGESSGELSPALSYIANFHTQEIEFELKRISDIIGPVLLGLIAGVILILALGVYLPIWNMVNLVRA